MLPTLKENTIYEIDSVGIKNICVGDIIAFYVKGKIICHRVIKVIVSANGAVFFETKGDNCETKDCFVVRDYMIIGKVIMDD